MSIVLPSGSLHPENHMWTVAYRTQFGFFSFIGSLILHTENKIIQGSVRTNEPQLYTFLPISFQLQEHIASLLRSTLDTHKYFAEGR
jgi:hypothetical protein